MKILSPSLIGVIAMLTLVGPTWGANDLADAADVVEDSARALHGVLDDHFQASSQYRSLRLTASRTHRFAEDLENAVEKGDFRQAKILLEKLDFHQRGFATDIYRQSPDVVPSKSLGDAIDLIHRLSREIESLRALLGAALRVPVDVSEKATFDIARPVSHVVKQGSPVKKVSLDGPFIEEWSDPVEVEAWDDVIDGEWMDHGSSFQQGGMQTNTLFHADGSLVDSRIIYRGYWERVENNNRIPTNWGGDWFDPTRPSRRFGPFGFGSGFGYGWSIYATFGPPYLSYFYSGNYFFSY
ncbi:hypothetical protein K2X85_04005 [bacterium]|nr:hypothetical protein [bacterium]